MKALRRRAKDFYEWISSRPTQVTAYVAIDHSHVQVDADANSPRVPFEADQHYFRAAISEMYLASSRKWFSEYYPLVYSAIEFNYGNLQQEEPKVVGPALLGQGETAALGTVFLDTPISGLHPYRGGDITFTVILYRAKSSDHLTDLISMVERVVGTVNPAIALAGYVGIAGVIVDGLEMILGTHQTDPIVGVRKTFGLVQANKFKPGYHALINAPDTSVKKEELWVREGRLYSGRTLETAVPYREYDFVLFQILQSDDRDDVNMLSFYPLWEETQRQVIDTKRWKEAKNTFSVMYRDLVLSHDLTEVQKEKLRLLYNQRFAEQRERSKQQAHLGVSRDETKVQPSVMDEKLGDLESLFDELD